MTKRSTILVLVFSFVALVSAGLAHVGMRMKVVRLGYEIGELSRERRALDEEHRRLQLERTLLRDPARIERLARDKLGMRRPEPAQLRVARPGTRELAQVTAP
jgi:cell division protein FtsL